MLKETTARSFAGIAFQTAAARWHRARCISAGIKGKMRKVVIQAFHTQQDIRKFLDGSD